MVDEQSLQELSDRLAILNLLAGSALSSDVSSETFQLGLYAEQAVLDRHADLPLYVGRESIAGIMRDPEHLAQVESGLIHLAGQPFVRVTGHSAVACGYLQVARTDPDPAGSAKREMYVATFPSLWMITANVWTFEYRNGQWLMVGRVLRDALSAEGRTLIRDVLEQR